MKRFITALFTALILFSGCNLEDEGISVLITDRPEFAAYVEAFNSSQSEYRILLKYSSDPVASLLSGEPGDLYVSEGLANSVCFMKLADFDEQIELQTIDLKEFYSPLLKTGVDGNLVKALPISFDLPIMIHRKEQTIESKFLSLSEIESIYKAQRNRSIRFSPWWNPELIYLEMIRGGADFKAGAELPLEFNENAVLETLDRLNSYTTEINGSVKQEKQYKDQYLYEPVYQLLNKKRIDFALSSLKEYSIFPDDQKKELDIIFYGWDEQIYAVDQILYAGVSADSRNSAAALAFISWFFKPETQVSLLKENRVKRVDSFGIGQGLSALKDVTELEFLVEYPWLVGEIPRGEHLMFLADQPLGWGSIQQDVLIPWFQKAFLNGYDSVETLKENLRTWDLQNQTDITGM